MSIFKRIATLLSFAVLAVFLLSIGATATVLADNGNIFSEFKLVENSLFVDPMGASGSGTFELDGRDLDNLKLKYKVKADNLMPKTWYKAAIVIRDLTDPNLDGPDDTVVVGFHKTNANGSLNFVGKAVLPDPTDSSPNGIVSGWRIDQHLSLAAGPGTDRNHCVDCVLVCMPTTHVQLNAAGDGLIPGTP